MPNHVPPPKVENKKKVIKKVRFHDDEPENDSPDEEDEDFSEEFQVRVGRKRPYIDDSNDQIQLRSKRLKTEEQPKRIVSEESSQETRKRKSIKAKKRVGSPGIEIVA